jgi:hypothetical protein
MFANPPPGTVNAISGINFDGAGVPINIQNLAGELKDFPGGGGGGGGIPIPANNDGANVVINSDQGGNITIAAPDEVAGDGGTINIISGYSPDGTAGAVNITGNSGFNVGGDVLIVSGSGDNGAVGSSQLYLQGGNGNPGQGGGFLASAGNGGPGGQGGLISFQAGNASGVGNAGDVEFLAGGRLGGAGAPGKIKFGRAAGGTLKTANGAQVVTIGAVGPGSAPPTVGAWLPLTIDGTDYVLPLFVVTP